MKIYHVETQQDYDALMSELEEKGYKWLSGHKPTDFRYWEKEKENTCIKISGKDITFRSFEQLKEQHQNTHVIEYKAKGENMLNTECKYCDEKWHHGNVKYCAMCGNKLVDDPEFKAGDIVSSEILPEGCGIIRLEEDLTGEVSVVYGIWYTNNDYEIQEVAFTVFKEDTRHATPSEIEEYEVALTFHKHGRDPFEVKKGDILKDNKGNILINDENILRDGFPKNLKKQYFTSGRYTFLKTAEEVNEWLENK